ncbi:MAG: FHA domain-containing protein [Kiritimatiellae bacterium]|nr:FHA domain-containing protein [Kiritimatiellia bacterium]
MDDQTQFQIEEGENLLLGRLDQCDVVVSDGSVSSRHARLSFLDGVLVVADLDSTNGTRVNYSLLVEPMALMDGDTVEFGNVTFTVDGPGLRTERTEVTDSVFINEFEPLDLAEPMDATMQLSAFTDEDLQRLTESSTAVHTDLEAVAEEIPDEGPERIKPPPGDSDWNGGGDADVEEADCSLGRILVTALFLVMFTGLMGLYLWRYVPAL